MHIMSVPTLILGRPHPYICGKLTKLLRSIHKQTCPLARKEIKAMPKKVVGIWLVKNGAGFFAQDPEDGYEMEVDENGIPTDKEVNAWEQEIWESTADEGPDVKVSYYITDTEGNDLVIANEIDRDDLFHEEDGKEFLRSN